MSIAELARPEIRALQPYEVTPAPNGAVRLNANEAPEATGNGSLTGLNRYPALRPTGLTARLADFYGVATQNVLVTRGSSEGIDLLIRTFCRPGQDRVLVTPPAFSLYEIYASVQGAGTVAIPLDADRDFALDTQAVIDACDDRTKLIFLCSPNNPAGSVIPREDILRVVEARAGKSLVVIDEAYVEYSNTDSVAPLVDGHDNLVVLRTLSKALALAGARCGAVVASPGAIRLLDGVLAPYALSAPVIDSAELALSRWAEAEKQIRATVAERERLRAGLAACTAVRRVWPSEANFLLVRFCDLAAVERRLQRAQIAIRSYVGDASLGDCARITVASAQDNDRLLQTIGELTC